MKKLSILLFIGIIAFSSNCFSQIKIDSNGQVGIANTTPNYRLDVNGTFRSIADLHEIAFKNGQFYSTTFASLGTSSYRWTNLYAVYPTFAYSPVIDSDIALKTDIANIPDILSKVKTLRPVSYKLKDMNGISEKIDPNFTKQTNFGFIAQEMTEIFPTIVVTRDDGTLGIRYTELIPVLVKAIQEQQAQIEALQKKIEAIESKN